MTAVGLYLVSVVLACLAYEMAMATPENSKAKRWWRIGFYPFALIGLGLVIYQYTHAQTKDDENAGIISSLTNQLRGISSDYMDFRAETDKRFRDISNDFSTNSAIDPVVRLEVLATEQKKVSEEGNQLQKKHELLNVSSDDLASIRAQRENELDLQENQKRQAEIQQQIDDIKNRQAQQLQKQAQQQQEQESEQAISQAEELIDAEIFPIFDYVIKKLDSDLEHDASGSGEGIFSDFPGGTPNVYASNLLKADKIVNGTNFLSIGTNSAWHFEISTTVPTIEKYPNYNKEPQYFAFIRIVTETTNGESMLIITPHLNNRMIRTRMFNRPDMTLSRYMTSPSTNWVIGISIRLKVLDGLNMDTQQSPQSYTKDIDEAIRRLIGDQDKQYPLPLKSS